MAGIVNSTKKRLLINKKIKEIEVPTTVLNTAQFFADLNTVGGNANQALVLSELAALPTLVKNECVTALVCGAYKEGKLYGYNGDTKSIEEFNFERQSAGTRFNSAGQMDLVAANYPRVDYNPANGQFKGYLLESASTNFLSDSGILNGLSSFPERSSFGITAVDTMFNVGELLSKGLRIDKVESSVPYAYKNCTVTKGLKYAFSFYAKSADSSQLTTADISVAIQGFPIAFSEVEFELVANGLTRVKCTFTATTGSTAFGVLKPVNSSVKSVIVTGFQLELNNVTSYIPTTAAAATRLSDKITANRPLNVFVKNSWYLDSNLYKGWLGNGVKGLKLTGRNYIKNSALFYSFTTNDSSALDMQSGIENGIRWISGTKKSTGKFHLSTYAIVANEPELSENMIGVSDVVTSVDLMATANITVRLGTAPFNLVAGIWQRVSAGGLSIDRILSLYADSNPEAPVDTKLYYKNYKTERGTSATPWSPAPEDFIKIAGNGNIEVSSDVPVSVRSLSLVARQLTQQEV